MPQINRKQIKPKKVKYNNEKSILQQDHYASPAWRSLRNTYISQFPLCRVCLEHEKITPAEQVHHKRFWSAGETEEEQWKLFLDWNNLESLCSSCHRKVHNKAKKYGLNYCDSLTEKEWRENDYDY